MKDLFGRLLVVWDGLMPRERILVAIAGGALAVLLLFVGILLPIQSASDRASAAADEASRDLDMMVRMKREWDGLHGRLDLVEQRIQQTRNQQNLLTLLESLAARAGVKPTSMEKRQSGESDDYEETKVEVSLKNVTLRQAVSYLSSIETNEQPLSVKSLRVKRRPGRARGDQPAQDLIDVTFSVSTFKPLG
ncbi:MAG: type II secretion system protein M [bacterium]|nr:type II secretion system protein M [bacterium]